MSFGSFLRGGFLIGAAVGAGAALFGPSIWRASRPFAKAALKAGLDGYAGARTAAARAAEEVEDLVVETVHEMQEAAAVPAPEADAEAEAGGTIHRSGNGASRSVET
jgi:hypothetical protein